MKIENNYIDQLIVRVGKACNFKCIFCNVSDNENNVKLKESINDIVRNFHYKLKYSNLDKKELLVTISGGEPSIFQKETIFALKYINSFLKKKDITTIFDIQTNASNIDVDFAKKLKDLGIYLALVSFHTNDKNIFNDIIGINYDIHFNRILEGINNLYNAGILVDVNIVLNKLNYNNFVDNIKFLLSKFPFIDTYNIGFFQPHGEADKNFEILFIDYSKAYKIYNEGILLLHNSNKKVISHYVGLPACYIDIHDYSLEVDENVNFRRNFKLNLNEKKLINNINDNNKTYSKDCIDCIYNNVCSGVWKEFIGKQLLKPIKYYKYFEEKTNDKYLYVVESNFYVINYLNEYNSGKKFIFFDFISLSNEKIDFVRNILKIGFYKISIYLRTRFDLSFLNTGITNFQIDIENISINDIENIYKFSISNAPQFRINLDIFINNYDDLLKMKNYLKLYNYDFMRFFIISPKTDDELNRYIDFLDNNILDFKKRVFTIGFFNDLLYTNK